MSCLPENRRGSHQHGVFCTQILELVALRWYLPVYVTPDKSGSRRCDHEEIFVEDHDRLVDPETGLSSQWHFEIVLDFVFPISHRGVTLTLVLFRIDDGDWATDHPNPKQVVADLGSALRGVTRSSDIIARYGEDRFICLLPLCNLQGGLVFADRTRDSLEDFTTRTGTTVSAAVASHRGEGLGSSGDMVKALERALERAQFAGGDRVELPTSGWNV